MASLHTIAGCLGAVTSSCCTCIPQLQVFTYCAQYVHNMHMYVHADSEIASLPVAFLSEVRLHTHARARARAHTHTRRCSCSTSPM